MNALAVERSLLLDVAWQGTGLLALGLLLSVALARRSARAHAALAAAVAGCLLAPWLTLGVRAVGWGVLEPSRMLQRPAARAVDVPASVPGAAGLGHEDAGRTATAHHDRTVLAEPVDRVGVTPPALRLSFGALVGVAWGAVALALLARLGLGTFAARRLIASADAELPRGVRRAMERAAAWVGVRPAPALRASGRVGSPVIWCWGKPVVVVPGRTVCEEPPGGWEGVLCHELAHLRRRDHIWSLLAELAICAMPWNPLAWAASRRLAVLSERACDEWALASGSAAESYAASLLAFVPRARPALAPAAVTGRADLPVRVRRILNPSLRPAPRVGAGLAMAIGLGAAAVVAGMALAQPGVAPPERAEAPAVVAQPSADASALAELDTLDPKAAEPLYHELGALSPDDAYTVLERVWGRIRNPKSKQRLAGIVLRSGGDGAQGYSPRTLDVLHLAATDPSIPVQNWALGRLLEITLTDFSHDYAAYLRWHERNAHRPVREVMAEGVRAYIGRLATLRGAALDEHADRLRALKRAIEALPPTDRGAAHEAIAGIAERWLATPDEFEHVLGDVFGLLEGAEVSEGYLRRVVLPATRPGVPPLVRTAAIRLLGAHRVGWAVDPLLNQLERARAEGEYARQFMASTAEALAEIGDPRAIPVMIAVIEADAPRGREPGGTAVYWVGYFGLGRMTGVEYKGTHDGAWWRRWWEENRDRYPAARHLEVPTLGRGLSSRLGAAAPGSPWVLAISAAAFAWQPADGDAGAPDTTAAPDPSAVRAWTARIAALQEAGRDERRGIIQELTDTDPDVAIGALRESWGGIADEGVRREILGTFATRGGVAQGGVDHPRLLDVLHLAMNDPSAEIRESAVHVLRTLAFRDFALRHGEYAAWHKANRVRPVAEVRREGLEALIARLREADTGAAAAEAEVLAWLDFALQNRPELATPRVREALLEVFERFLADPLLASTLHGNAVSLISRLEAPEAYLRRVVVPAIARPELPPGVRGSLAHLLADPAHAWAVDFLVEQLAAPPDHPDAPFFLHGVARALAEIGDPRAVPAMIAAIEADPAEGRDPGETATYWVGYYGLSTLTGVDYHESHGGAWWRDWWTRNKIRYPEAVRAMEIPRFSAPAESGGKTEGGPAVEAGFPVDDVRIGGDEKKRYFLVGPKREAPERGHALLVVLPGGDGSAEFRPFVANILRSSLPEGFIVAQAVAPVWTDDEDRIVWPTALLADPGMAFPTEAFIAEIVVDVKARHAVDPARVYALGWSSGGPPVYTATLMEGSPLAGAFVAMSVFKPDMLPPLDGAKGKAFYILHSPQDFIPMRFPEAAAARLAERGAATMLTTYEGGHGWRGDVFGMIRRGIEWMEMESEGATK